MTMWQTMPLTDVLEFREGPGIMARDFRDSGVPLLRLAGLKSGAPLLEGCNFLDPGMVDAKWDHFRVEVGDVLLSTSASLGEVACVDESAAGAVPYTGIINFRPRNDRMSPRFIRFALTERSFKLQVEAMGVGSVMRHFGPSHLRKMAVTVPPIGVQEGIADMLGALDDKIAANAKLVSTIGYLAETMYRELMSSPTKSASLVSILTLEYGKPLPAGCRKDGAVAVYGSGGVVGSHDRALLTGPGVVVGRKGTAGAVHWAAGPFYPIDTTFYVVPSSADFPMIFCYFALRSLGLDEMNSDSAVPGLNRNEAHAAIARIPEVTAMSSFGGAATVLFQQRAQLQRECESLASMRDVLLPQLMSGRIRVKDVEQMVGDVV